MFNNKKFKKNGGSNLGSSFGEYTLNTPKVSTKSRKTHSNLGNTLGSFGSFGEYTLNTPKVSTKSRKTHSNLGNTLGSFGSFGEYTLNTPKVSTKSRKTHSNLGNTLGSFGSLDELFVANTPKGAPPKGAPPKGAPLKTSRKIYSSLGNLSRGKKKIKSNNKGPCVLAVAKANIPVFDDYIEKCILELNHKFHDFNFVKVDIAPNEITETRNKGAPLVLIRDNNDKEYFIKKAITMRSYNELQSIYTPKEGIANRLLIELLRETPCSSNLLLPFYVSDDFTTIVIEKKNTDLLNYLYNLLFARKILDQREFLIIFRDILLAVECLHSGNSGYIIIHGDIKPENILLELDNDDRVAKALLFDFDGIAFICNTQDIVLLEECEERLNGITANACAENIRNKVRNRLSKITSATAYTHNWVGKHSVPVVEPDIYQDIYSIAVTMLYVLSTVLGDSYDALDEQIIELGERLKENYGVGTGPLIGLISTFLNNLKELIKKNNDFPYTENFCDFFEDFLIDMVNSRTKKYVEDTEQPITVHYFLDRLIKGMEGGTLSLI